MILAYFAGKSLQAGESMDLINVAFQQADEGYAVPDRLTAFQAYEEMHSLLAPRVNINLILVNVTKTELREMRETHIKSLLFPLETVLGRT